MLSLQAEVAFTTDIWWTLPDIPKIKKVKPSINDQQILGRLKMQYDGLADFILLSDDGQPVSFVLKKWKGKPTHSEYPDIEDLYTTESYRGRGYGTFLIKECERRAQERGYSKIGLAVNPKDNPKAKRLYEKLGYVHDGKSTYVDGVYDGVEDWVIDLEKEL